MPRVSWSPIARTVVATLLLSASLTGWAAPGVAISLPGHGTELLQTMSKRNRRQRLTLLGDTASALAAGGARVALVDRADFASTTSQESSNLVWGGFKYLENYELPLVFGLCRSRNRLMKAYPANIREIGFYAALDEAEFPPQKCVVFQRPFHRSGQGRCIRQCLHPPFRRHGRGHP